MFLLGMNSVYNFKDGSKEIGPNTLLNIRNYDWCGRWEIGMFRILAIRLLDEITINFEGESFNTYEDVFTNTEHEIDIDFGADFIISQMESPNPSDFTLEKCMFNLYDRFGNFAGNISFDIVGDLRGSTRPTNNLC